MDKKNINFVKKSVRAYKNQQLSQSRDIQNCTLHIKYSSFCQLNIQIRTMGNKSQPSDCGCFGDDDSSDELIAILLQKINYDICIYNGLAQVTMTQIYSNDTGKFLQLSYRFPVNPNACLHKFTATYSNLRIEAIVKEKEEAKMEYQQALDEGKYAAYGQISQISKDIMKINIGNIPPKESVQIEIVYIEELGLMMNTFYAFGFLSKLNPRYVNSIPKQDRINAFKKQVQTVSGSFEWDFKLRLRASRKITSYYSVSHNLVLQGQDDTQTDLIFTLEKGSDISKDFSFMYTTQHFELPSYTLGQTDSSSTVMVSFIPKFCSLSLEDSKIAALKSISLQTDMDAVKGEYIFLLDRSESMRGSRIQNAKRALILFLKSLPIDTYFNVVSFGSSYSFLSHNSMRNGNQNIAKALQQIENIGADMGGTNIQQPLQNILKAKVIEGYPKQIFLLTDGEVSDTEKVIDLVRRNIKYSRVHTIGIGSGASESLIKGCAEKGKGYHIFIKDNQNPSEKIIQLLTDSLTPVISQIYLKYDKELVESVFPNPESIPYILKGQVANFYVTFKGQLNQKTIVSLQYFDSMNNLPFASSIQILPFGESESFIDKMGHFRTIKALQESEAQGENNWEHIHMVKEVNLKKQIIDLSVRHQVLSKYTAFVCSQQQLVDGKYQQVKSKGQHSVQIVEMRKIQQQREYQSRMTGSSRMVGGGGGYSEQVQQQQQHQWEEKMEIEQIVLKTQIVDDYNFNFQFVERPKNYTSGSADKKTKAGCGINQIIGQQDFEGSWSNIDIIHSLLGKDVANHIRTLSDASAVITFLILKWIARHHPYKEYALIVKKSIKWLKKQPNSQNYCALYQKLLKQL